MKLWLLIICIVNEFTFYVFMNMHTQFPVAKRGHFFTPCPIAYLSFISSCGWKKDVAVGYLCIKWKPNGKRHDADPSRS